MYEPPSGGFFIEEVMSETNATAETLAEGEKPVTTQEVSKEFVTLADEDEEQPDETETEETEEEAESKEGEKEEAQTKKRPSGSARLKARLRVLEQELTELRRAPAPKVQAADGEDDLVEPKESDFPNDYLAFDRALRAYETRRAIRDENKRVADSEQEQVAQRAHRQRLNAYNTRLEDVKDRIPDFDATMRQANDVPIRDDVRDMILEDEKGPLLAYHLAKNPEKLDALNRMSPIEAARQIGKLSARIRGPQVKTVTSARPPLSTVRGGAGASAKDPSTMSMEEYNKWRDGQDK